MTKTSPLESLQIAGFSKEYAIEKELSSGSYGRVYQVRHIPTGNHYACKFVQKSSLSQRQISCTRYEMGLLGRLNHPNVVRLHRAIETGEYMMMIMELMKGGDLLDRMEAQGVFPESTARDILLQIATGIKYLHDLGIAHRDIKVENIMFESPDTTVTKLADFGLSKLIGKTPTNTPVGTPHYMAPEIIAKKAHSTSVDIWSFGCVAFILLYGSFPFHSSSSSKGEEDKEQFPSLKEKISSGVFAFPNKGYKVSREVKDLITKALVLDPAERLTIDEVLEHPWFKMPLSPPPSPSSSSSLFLGRSSGSFKALFRFGLKAERQRVDKLEVTPEMELKEGLQEELEEGLRKNNFAFFSVLSSKLLKKRRERGSNPSSSPTTPSPSSPSSLESSVSL